MEFQFNVNRLLPRKINRISHTLLPEDFRGDRREYTECQRLLSRVLDDMGEASAKAQGLSKPITSALKLRDTDHSVYLLVDSEANNGYGCVVGLLKSGSKNLFMFDENGIQYQLQPRCILDFYIHESRQRMGLGNVLYQHMLAEEKTRPVKLAIDRPSEKFLQFLRKHYGLDRIIPQNNKFVVFRGFFDDESQDVRSGRYSLPPKTANDADSHSNNNRYSMNSDNCQSTPSSNGGAPYSAASRSAYGRYAAARPPCSMANIIHNAAVLGQTAERTGELPASTSKPERPRSLSLYSEDEQKHRTIELTTVPTPDAIPDDRPATLVPADATSADRPPNRQFASSISSASTNRDVRAISTAKATKSQTISTADNRDRANSATRAADARVTSAAFGPLVDHQAATSAFASMHLESTTDMKPTSATVAAAGSSVKASPSCGQEVGGNQSGHLDLKFYHSPLW